MYAFPSPPLPKTKYFQNSNLDNIFQVEEEKNESVPLTSKLFFTIIFFDKTCLFIIYTCLHMNFLAKIHATNMKKQILNHPHKPKNALLIKALMFGNRI